MTDHLEAALRIEALAVEQGGRVLLRDVTLEVAPGETLAVIGPSGSGKSSLLRAIAGLMPLAHGSITLGGRRVDTLAPHQRGIVYLSQEPLLFPHLDVFENIAFGLRLRRFADETVHAMVGELIGQLGLDGLARRRPDALSGGQRQRVAFGRALIVAPTLLLLDEPFSNLDPDTRLTMQRMFKEITHARGVSAVFVTHELKESLRMGDRYAIVRDQRLRQYDDRAAFCADPDTGVAREAGFWRELASEGRATTMNRIDRG